MVFVGRILGRNLLYRYADPLGALNVAVMLGWRRAGLALRPDRLRDRSLLQSSTSGGDFLNAEHLRSDRGRVLRRRRSRAGPATLRNEVTTVPMRPGTLMLFAGRHSLHAVSSGPRRTPRYVALLAYDTRPDTNSSELLKQVRYGRYGLNPRLRAGREGFAGAGVDLASRQHDRRHTCRGRSGSRSATVLRHPDGGPHTVPSLSLQPGLPVQPPDAVREQGDDRRQSTTAS